MDKNCRRNRKRKLYPHTSQIGSQYKAESGLIIKVLMDTLVLLWRVGLNPGLLYEEVIIGEKVIMRNTNVCWFTINYVLCGSTPSGIGQTDRWSKVSELAILKCIYNEYNEGHSTIYVFDLHQNVYSEVASKKPREAIASKYTISYQNKDLNKSNLCKVILSQIRLQRLDLDRSTLVDIVTNKILY